MISKIFLSVLATCLVISASACNTVRGAGDDLESAANTVDDEM